MTNTAEYARAIYLIVTERYVKGGWPATDTAKVSGWAITRLIADLYRKPVNEVARDIIWMAEDTRETA